MKPLNRAERNNAFLGFLLLFVITIGTVLTVVFVSIEVPFRENEQLRRRIIMMQKEKKVSDSFKVAMNVALNELAMFDLKEKPVSVIQRSVQLKIDKMSRIVRNMPDDKFNDDKSMYDLVIQNVSDLGEAKLRIRNLEAQRN
jgi:hypothetical protein